MCFQFCSQQIIAFGIAEIGKEKRNIIFPWHLPEGLQVYHRLCIGVARMPAGKGDVVVRLIVDVPAENDVAKRDPVLEAGGA